MEKNKKVLKAHSPHDETYGPLFIPDYCWPIIDTPEFQRLRHIRQLGCNFFVYSNATHTRFEHSLGCAHLASLFMDHLMKEQPELKLKKEHFQAVVIAALCHDIGHGPYSHCFEEIANTFDRNWNHEDMSIKILNFIADKYKIDVSSDVIEAASCYIAGKVFEKYPKYLAEIVANHDNDIDIDKLDYLVRDINRSLNISIFEFKRLIYHCRVVEDRLAWKISEIQTIERMFFNRNNMHQKVYQHHTIQGIDCMIRDMIKEASDYNIDIGKAISDVEQYCKLDDRIFTLILDGKCGPDAQAIAKRISERKLYKLVGELKMNPDNQDGITYSQNPIKTIVKDIAEYGVPDKFLRIAKQSYRYGINKDKHPLLSIPFWKSESENKVIMLTESEISSIVPIHFKEIGMRVYVTDEQYIQQAKKAFDLWRTEKCYQ